MNGIDGHCEKKHLMFSGGRKEIVRNRKYKLMESSYKYECINIMWARVELPTHLVQLAVIGSGVGKVIGSIIV